MQNQNLYLHFNTVPRAISPRSSDLLDSGPQTGLPLRIICELQKKKQRLGLYSSPSESIRTILDVEPFTISEGDADEDHGGKSLLQEKVKIYSLEGQIKDTHTDRICIYRGGAGSTVNRRCPGVKKIKVKKGLIISKAY